MLLARPQINSDVLSRSVGHGFSRPLCLLASLGAFAVGGCAYQLNSLAAKSSTDLGPKHDAKPSEVDLAYARAVAAAALARGDRDDSIAWRNPNTGAGGNITPLASSYAEGPFTCRDFLASYVRRQTEAWLQGEACRTITASGR